MECTRRILGIDFFIGGIDRVVERAMQGGLMVVPSGPGLATDFVHSPVYRQSLLTADMAITDSGFMVLLWCLRTGERLPKNSGLAFMHEWVAQLDRYRDKTILWIMPSAEETARTQAWMRSLSMPVDERYYYLAPFYGKGPYEDEALVAKIEELRPDVIMIGLGGGVQECLGMNLRNRLDYRPSIFCVGAAIAFLTGGQAPIPVWVDRISMGWLYRILDSPKKFWRRYWEAFRLTPVLFKYKDKLPPIKAR